MRRFLLTLLPAVLLCSFIAIATAGEQLARSLAGQFSVTSEQGWPGRRYVEGGVTFAEEFDSNGDNRLDIWRFYRRGVLSSEEQDLNFDGRVDLITLWNPRDPMVKRLTSLARDTGHRGFFDLEMEAESDTRWIIREDRNLNGVADHILTAVGPYKFFEDLALNLGNHPNVIERVPLEYWVEYRADPAYSGFVTDYRRYSRGLQTHYGEWDGRRLRWLRFDSRRPQPAAPAPLVAQTAPVGQGSAAQPQPASTAGFAPAPGLDVTGAPVYVDGGMAVAAPGAPLAPAAPDASTGYYYDSTYVDASPTPPLRDRTRYDGLPPGDSAARSLPARMRPPGEGPRR